MDGWDRTRMPYLLRLGTMTAVQILTGAHVDTVEENDR